MVFTHKDSIVGAGRLFLKSFSNKLPDLLTAIPGNSVGNKLRRTVRLGWLPGLRLLLVPCGELPEVRRCVSLFVRILNSLSLSPLPLSHHAENYTSIRLSGKDFTTLHIPNIIQEKKAETSPPQLTFERSQFTFSNVNTKSCKQMRYVLSLTLFYLSFEFFCGQMFGGWEGVVVLCFKPKFKKLVKKSDSVSRIRRCSVCAVSNLKIRFSLS